MGKRMKKAKRLPVYVLRGCGLVVSLLAMVAQLAAAWSAWLPPQEHPRASLLGFAFPFLLVANAALLVGWLLVRRRYACVPALALLLTLPTVRAVCPFNWPRKAPKGSLELMTFNVFNLSNPDKLPKTQLPLVQYIVGSGADIVCCQEAGGMDDKAVDSLLAMVYPYRDFHASSVLGDHMLCLSKYPILDVDTVEVAEKRGPSLAYRIQVGQDTLLLVNNHLESYKLTATDKAEYKEMLTEPSDTAVRKGVRTLLPRLMEANRKRGPQAERVAQYIEASESEYIVCMGDMNDTPMSYVHHRLTRRLHDAYTRTGNGMGWSYHRSGMYFRIDHILTSPSVKAYEAHVDRSCKDSDHYPLRCRIVLRHDNR